MGLLKRREARRGKDRIAPLTPVPTMADLPEAKLQPAARYLGTVTEAGEEVAGHSVSVASSSRLNLSSFGLDVVRMAGSFRIPADSLRGATQAEEFGGRPAESLQVVQWEHGEQPWCTGLRMDPNKSITSGPSAPDVDQWARTISKMARKASRKAGSK